MVIRKSPFVNQRNTGNDDPGVALMHIRIYIGPLFGMGIFSFGLYSLRYVQSRVFRSSKQVKNMRDLIRKYRALISSGSAPSWPLADLALRMRIP